MNLDGMNLDVVIANARENLKKYDYLLPTFFIGQDGKIGIFGAKFDSTEEKDMLKKSEKLLLMLILLFLSAKCGLYHLNTFKIFSTIGISMRVFPTTLTQ
jgi:hypothetical protein